MAETNTPSDSNLLRALQERTRDRQRRRLRPLPPFPYPALAAYDSRHRALFAGREADLQNFVDLLNIPKTRLVVLHGESGAGKSSFLLAGLLPILEEDGIGYQILRKPPAPEGQAEGERTVQEEPAEGERGVLFVRAGTDLSGQFARRLAQPITYQSLRGQTITFDVWDVLGRPADVGSPASPEGVQAAFRRDPELLGKALAALGEHLPFGPVLVVDQCEEVFTLLSRLKDKEVERRQAQKSGRLGLELLRLAARTSGRFKVIVSLRTEYFGRVSAWLRQGTSDEAGIREYFLDNLGAGQLLEAIGRPTLSHPIPYSSEIPSKKYQFRFAPGVAEEIAHQARAFCADRPDSVLPLVQVICAQLYESVRPQNSEEIKEITAEHLKTAGGIEGGMKKHVQDKLTRLFPYRREQQSFKRILAELYTSQPDGPLTKVHVPVRDLKPLWKSRRLPFEVMLKEATGGNLPLLRAEEFHPVGRSADEYVSLGHDALAPVAKDWHEELEQAEQARQRRLRWSLPLLLGALIVMAFLAALAWYWKAKAEEHAHAEKDQRTQVEHNLSRARDAVEKFTAVGVKLERIPDAVPVHRTMLQLALHYYEFVAQQGDAPERRADVATYQMRVAKIYRQLYEKPKALKAYKRAIELYERLVEDQPSLPAHRFDLAVCHNASGLLYLDLGQAGKAERAFRNALQLVKKLVAEPAAKPEYRRTLAAVHNHLGVYYLRTGLVSKAERPLQEALHLRALLAQAPEASADDKKDLAVSYDHLGLFLDEKGDGRPAEKAYRKSWTILKALKDEQGDSAFPRDLAIVSNNLGALYRDLGRTEEAEAAYKEALGLRRKLVQKDPFDPDPQRRLASVLNNLGNLYRDTGRKEKAQSSYADALAAYHDALKIFQKLARENPDVPVYQWDLAWCLNNLGKLHFDEGKKSLANAAYEEARISLEKLKIGYPDISGTTDFAETFADTCTNLGDLLLEDRKFKAAVARYDLAIAALDPVFEKEPSTPVRHALSSAYLGRAETLARLGQGTAAAKDWAKVRKLCEGSSYLRFRLKHPVALVHLGDYQNAVQEVAAMEAAGLVWGRASVRFAGVCALASAAARTDRALTPGERDKQAELYAARAVALIKAAREAHYFRLPGHLERFRTDPDLEPLRSRRDFQELAAALEADARGGGM